MFKHDFPHNSSALFHFYPPTTGKIQGFISIPHSGEEIPKEFNSYLSGDEKAYMEDVDFKVNELVDIERLNANNIVVLQSKIHRVAIDLNRAPEKSVLHWEFNTKGQKIRLKEPTPNEQEKFLNLYYTPYYEIIKSTLQELERVYNSEKKVPVIDLHSMPSRPTEYHLKINPKQKAERPDFCLSDLRGKSCSTEYIHFLKQELANLGYNPSINDPYFGGYVTEYMNKFRTNAVQIEVKRGLYMDEEKKELVLPQAEKVKEELTLVLLNLFHLFGHEK